MSETVEYSLVTALRAKDFKVYLDDEGRLRVEPKERVTPALRSWIDRA
jgi:hypothetical protein